MSSGTYQAELPTRNKFATICHTILFMLGGFMLAAMHLCYVFVKTCRGALPKHDTDIPQCGYYYGYLEWLALGVAVVATANNASRTILVSSAIFLLLFVAMGANIMLGARDLRL